MRRTLADSEKKLCQIPRFFPPPNPLGCVQLSNSTGLNVPSQACIEVDGRRSERASDLMVVHDPSGYDKRSMLDRTKARKTESRWPVVGD